MPSPRLKRQQEDELVRGIASLVAAPTGGGLGIDDDDMALLGEYLGESHGATEPRSHEGVSAEDALLDSLAGAILEGSVSDHFSGRADARSAQRQRAGIEAGREHDLAMFDKRASLDRDLAKERQTHETGLADREFNQRAEQFSKEHGLREQEFEQNKLATQATFGQTAAAGRADLAKAMRASFEDPERSDPYAWATDAKQVLTNMQRAGEDPVAFVENMRGNMRSHARLREVYQQLEEHAYRLKGEEPPPPEAPQPESPFEGPGFFERWGKNLFRSGANFTL